MDLTIRSAVAMWKSGSRYPTFLLDQKLVGHEFAKSLGLNVPKIYKAKVPLSEISFAPCTAVKPVHEDSGRGVFIVDQKGSIFHLNSATYFSSEVEAKNKAQQLLDNKTVSNDDWMIEELILSLDNSIARDVKFYTFYGKIGLILETSRIPKIRRCWYDVNENIVKTGKYDDILFKGAGNLKALTELARSVSRQVPAPFARVDFLVSGGTTYFGEITPVPGSHGAFNHKWDTTLGAMFTEASCRLVHDVAYGKTFSAFSEIEKDGKKIANTINASHASKTERKLESA